MLNFHDQLAIAHATLACVAVLFTLPVALLAGRYLRSRGAVWFRIHMIFNSITTFLIVLVFGLGVAAVGIPHKGTSFEGPSSDLHHKLGLGIFITVLCQATLGFIAHKFNIGHTTRKFHITLGIFTVAGLYWQVWEGMHNEWAETSVIKTVTPMSVQVLFWIITTAAVTAYMLAVGKMVVGKLANSAESQGAEDEGVVSNRKAEVFDLSESQSALPRLKGVLSN